MEPSAPGSVFFTWLSSFILISWPSWPGNCAIWVNRRPLCLTGLQNTPLLLNCINSSLSTILKITATTTGGISFQLCSLPMYLCLFLPFLTARKRALLFTFMYQYNLLGALLVFAEPSGLMHPYWTLTLHGFFWHGILVFIGFFILFSGRASSGNDVFLKTTALFLSCCAIAAGINVLSRQVALPPWQDADMFYISPFYPNTQIVFHQIARALWYFWQEILLTWPQL